MRSITIFGIVLLGIILLLAGSGGTVVNSHNPTDGAAMVRIPGGTFTMGTEFGYAWWNAPYKQQVSLSDYWIYKYDVTVAEYRAFCAATGHSLPPWPGEWLSWTGDWTNAALQQHPIVNVSWYDAKAYADWAHVSLPTEAQWEYASRGPAGNNYPWGGTGTSGDPYNGWDQMKCVNYVNSYADGKSTWPVDSFPAGASWCGAEDMAGNVWQWCADWYGNYSSTPVTNPTGPVSGSFRVQRGGSWDSGVNGDGEFYGRGAYRSYGSPDGWYYLVGFRCVSPSPGS